MGEEIRGAVSRRERLILTVTALVPAALGLLRPLAGRAGALAWLAPVAALPAGLLLCPVWQDLGQRDLPRGLEEAFGRSAGKCLEALYLLWALFLLAGRADGYARRLMTTTEGENVRWLFLGVGLALCLWLCRGRGVVLVRTGKLFFMATLAVLGTVLVLTLPGLEWQNLWPPKEMDPAGLLPAGIETLSLAGYGVFALCLPRQEGGQVRPGGWAAGSCLGLAGILLATLGAFGPELTAQMEEPFLFLLQGVGVPGAFQRGEAALTAALALADWTLLALLVWGCRALWRALLGTGRGSWLPVTAAFLGAGLLPRWPALREGMAGAALWGNLIFGVGIPVLSFLLKKVRGR